MSSSALASGPSEDEEVVALRLDAAEESKLVIESNSLKSTANTCFTSADYDAAILGYNRALDTLPSYLDYEIAVLKSNIAACYIKLEEWKDAIETATAAIDSLERIDPTPTPKKDSSGKASEEAEPDSKVEEVDDATADRIEALQRTGHSIDDARKIRAKALLRRAKARAESGGWANLAGADEDYRALAAMATLTPTDRRAVERALRELPPRLDEARQRETGEMMGKLKQLGNGILRPFGLSTENFNMVKDEGSGGYSLQFNQGK